MAVKEKYDLKQKGLSMDAADGIDKSFVTLVNYFKTAANPTADVLILDSHFVFCTLHSI